MAETLKEFFIKVNFDNSGFDKLQQKTKQFTENVTSKFKVETDKQVQIQKSANEKMVQNTQQMANSQVAIFKKIASYLPAVFSTAFIKSSVSDFVKKGMEADETSSLLGISPEAFQQISGAFNRFGVEANALEGQLASLNQDIAEATKGEGKLIRLQEQFGLTIKNASGEVMSADEMLLSMTKQLKDFDAKTKAGILRILGFDTAVQSAFSDGGEALMGFLAKQKELMLITQKDTEMAKKFTFQMKDLRDNITRIKNVIARFFLPVLTKLAEITTKFIGWIFKHKTAFVAILSIIALSLKGILVTLGAIIIKGAILAAPFIAVGALIVGLILLFEDIYYYFNGWDSVTGELVKKFPLLGMALDIIKPLVKGIFETIDKIIEFFKNPSVDKFIAIFKTMYQAIKNQANKVLDIFKNAFDEIAIAWKNIDWLETLKQIFGVEWWSEEINKVLDMFKKMFRQVADFFKQIFNEILDWFSEKIQSIISPIKKVGEKVGGFIDKTTDSISSAWEGTKDTFGSAWEGTKMLLSGDKDFIKSLFGFGNKTDPLPVVNSSNAYSTNNNFNQNIEVSVNGSVDRRNADYLAHSIGNQLRGTNFQNGSTGRF